MKHSLIKTTISLLLIVFAQLASAQIFEPEGLNIPGTWNSFVNPPLSDSPFGSGTQVNNGGVQLINAGTRRWQAGFYCSNAPGSVSSGVKSFLFTSGPVNNAYANKWSGTAVQVNTLQNYVFNNLALPDNSVTLDSNFWYTINWRDAGYQSTSAIFMKTENEPITPDSLHFTAASGYAAQNTAVGVTVFLPQLPSPEERFFIRYTTDGFGASQIVPLTGSDSILTATIPGQLPGAEVNFYVFSSTIVTPTANFDMVSLRILNNDGLNYRYSVLDTNALVNLGPDFELCSGTGPWDLAVNQTYESYLWSTGSTDSSITVSQPGTYWVEVALAGFVDRDTITFGLLPQPDVDLGGDTVVCSGSTLLLESGFSFGPSSGVITIIYDATQGQTQLADLDTLNDGVYMHAGYEAVPFGGAVNWVGNWGQDDGVGAMTYLGNNLWSITFNIFEYFAIPGNASVSGLFLVFRNSDGSLTGKDDFGNDIFINLQQGGATSVFDGISADVEYSPISSIIWSDGSENSSLEVSQSGTYSVTITTNAGCEAIDSISVQFLTVPALQVSNDTVLCSNSFSLQLQANGNFETYQWSNGSTASSILVSQGGDYVVTATAQNSCIKTDTVSVTVAPLLVNSALLPSYLLCGSGSVVLSPGVSLSPQGDSLTITYDATQGQTQLVDAPSIYMHSTFEYAPFTGGVEPWVGNWGQDDGIGQMIQIGDNLWSITINIYDYYAIPVDSLVNGLFIVFRNADGTLTGKDDSGNDIFLNLNGPFPGSTFNGITATLNSSPVSAILWSNGSSTSEILVSQGGTYTVSFIDDNGCVVSDTTQVNQAQGAEINLGADRILCNGESATLNAGSGFAQYTWNTGATQSSIQVNTNGVYGLTAVSSEGCTASDSVNVQVINAPVAQFSYAASNGLLVSFIDQSTGPAAYAWDFESDGIVDLTLPGNQQHEFDSAGVYTVRLVVSNLCGSDTLEAIVDLSSAIGFETHSNKMLRMWPNPASDYINIALNTPVNTTCRIWDISGRLVREYLWDGEPQKLDVSSIHPGVYAIEIVSGDGSIVKKIIIQ